MHQFKTVITGEAFGDSASQTYILPLQIFFYPEKLNILMKDRAPINFFLPPQTVKPGYGPASIKKVRFRLLFHIFLDQ